MPTPIGITISNEQRATLTSWTRKGKTEKRLADRARMVLLSAAGVDREAIAHRLGITPGLVSKWRRRFVERGAA